MSENIFKENIDLSVSFKRFDKELSKRGRLGMLSQFYSNYPHCREFRDYRERQYKQYILDGLTEEQANERADADVLQQRDLLIEKTDLPVIGQLMNAIGEEFNELYDAILKMLFLRTLNEATGENLDIIGELVGAERTLYDYSTNPWFMTDNEAKQWNPDVTPAWVTGAKLSGDATADDEQYRRIILAKVFKNHTFYASIPEIRTFVKVLLNRKISFMKTGELDATVVVPIGIPVGLVHYLISKTRNILVDDSYNLPVPPTVRLSDEVMYLAIIDEEGDACSFAPDQEAGRVDYGRATVMIYV